ncbi:MAG: N-acetylmuramoyl-L-alanine amidase [Pseudomonadota bacterium]
MSSVMGLSGQWIRLVVLCLALFACAPIVAADVAGVRAVGNGDPSRLTIWLTRATETRTFIRQVGNQRQLVVDLVRTDALSGPSQPLNAATGLVSYRWADGQLVFDLTGPMMVARELDLPPTGSETQHRLVLDLARVAAARFDLTAERDGQRLERLAESRARRARENAAAEQARLAAIRHVVVIDAGHGGKDPGATAVSGVHEKDIVLKTALALKQTLEADGRFLVRLTRDDDTFIALEDRVTMAREWGADLFISLHADAAAKPSVAGASVYTISERGERRIEREAERNDWHLEIEDGATEEVSGILEDLVKRETKTNSGLFAAMLIPHLQRAGPILRNTHRNAGFYVLLAPDVPAVLVEIGFLTNRDDARRLASASGRARTVTALAAAITEYFGRQDAMLALN